MADKTFVSIQVLGIFHFEVVVTSHLPLFSDDLIHAHGRLTAENPRKAIEDVIHTSFRRDEETTTDGFNLHTITGMKSGCTQNIGGNREAPVRFDLCNRSHHAPCPYPNPVLFIARAFPHSADTLNTE